MMISNMKVSLKQDVKLEAGMVFQHEDGERYMLACIGVNQYTLISLWDANRWEEPKSLDEIAKGLSTYDHWTYIGQHISQYSFNK